MKTLKYTVIKSEKQYNEYCDILEMLIAQDKAALVDEIELLTVLIEKWDAAHNTFSDLNPVELIKTLMVENNMRPKDLVNVLGLSKGTVSKILNYHKGLSKETIRRLADYFKVSQEAFNRPYKLINEADRHLPEAIVTDLREKVFTG